MYLDTRGCSLWTGGPPVSLTERHPFLYNLIVRDPWFYYFPVKEKFLLIFVSYS